MSRLSFFLVLLLGVAALPLGGGSLRETPVVRVVQRALPAVVSIGTEQTIRVQDPYITRLNEYFSLYRSRTKRVKEYQPLGSGILLGRNGMVLTNWHVVRAAENILVKLHDNRSVYAKTVGYDEQCDLCILKLESPPKGVDGIPFGKPNDLLLGETVVALGSPFGLDNSVATGVLSAINRSLSARPKTYDDILQTDAAINPGNSGGPLLNLDGELLGINQAIRSDAQGIGFAIPIPRIESFLSAWLLPEVFSSAAPQFSSLENADELKGVLLSPLSESQAEKCGIKATDVIVSLNGKPVRRIIDFLQEYQNCKPGDTVTLQTRERQFSFVLPEMTDMQLIEQRLGIRLQKLTRGLKEALELPGNLQGLAVSEILAAREYQAQNQEWKKYLKRGDILLSSEDTILSSVKDLAALLRSRTSGEVLPLEIAFASPQDGNYYRTQITVTLK